MNTVYRRVSVAARIQAPAGTPGNDALLSRSDDADFEAFLHEWMRETLGADEVSVQPIVAGTRSSWSVDVTRGDDLVPVIVRRTRDTLQVYGDESRETQIYRALAHTPVPVPDIYAVDTERGLVAAQRVAGTDDLSGLDPATREAVSDELMRHIAALHALDPTALELPPMPVPTTAQEHATLDLDHWLRFHAANAPANPVVTFAGEWLRRNAPNDVDRTVLVQGDTGPGNFVQHEGRVTAVVDWELSHLGDPYEDLGWVVARALLFPFGNLTRRFEVYSEASGLPFDRARIWHGAVSAMLKILIAGDVVRARGHDDPQYPIMVSGPAFHGRLVIDALRELAGVEQGPVSLEPQPDTGSEREGSLAFIRTTLRERLLPSLSDPYQIAQAKAALRTVRHLQQGERYDAAIEDQERRDLASLLGEDMSVAADGRKELCERIRADTVDTNTVLSYLGRHVQRETVRMAELLGPMATTPLPRF
ncbi:phosphotransferase family protein [Mycolicibacterium flavescens]|uniref:phosphotransferase n=1 Tax=Mycolicibacterium flavescens TaxID=1776 RepID=UPI001041BF94|nr:phosphotransferase [Mycolicibacterium flavescens]MCV7282377.1 phosphotransferase family protein [Mycolicibacterium flavescens]